MKWMSRYRKKVIIEGMIYLALILASLYAIFPILWGLFTSIKTTENILTYPPKWLPVPVTFEHYKSIISSVKVIRFFANSLIVALASIAVTLIVASHASYASARFKFKGKNFILFMILATKMIPGISILVPVYILAAKLGLHDRYLGLTLIYCTWQVPIVLWLVKGFIETIPVELEEAALIDGCSRLKAFYFITLPTIQPGLAAAAIMVFQYVWNDFLISSVLTISEEMRSVQVGLYRYITEWGRQWGNFFAYTTLAILPVVVIFIILQKRFIQGLTAGSIKG